METGGNTAPAPDAGTFDIDSIIGGTSQTETTSAAGESEAKQGAKEFVFGGRKYPSQKEAEAAHGKLYGKYSEQAGHVNALKEVLRSNPALAKQLAQDPKMQPILAKLGIQTATEDMEAETEESEAEGAEALEELRNEIAIERESFKLEREFDRFERSLGREMTQEERTAVLKVIHRASSLSVEEAYYLVNRDRLMKEAVDKATATKKPKVERPNPIPSAIPGAGKIDKSKTPSQMTPEEFRQDLREHYRENFGP